MPPKNQSAEAKTKIAESQKKRWASMPKSRRDEQARLMNAARRLKRLEKLQPQIVVAPEDVPFYLAEKWTVHVAQPIPGKVVLNRPEAKP